jgi:hypothetical protein
MLLISNVYRQVAEINKLAEPHLYYGLLVLVLKLSKKPLNKMSTLSVTFFALIFVKLEIAV